MSGSPRETVGRPIVSNLPRRETDTRGKQIHEIRCCPTHSPSDDSSDRLRSPYANGTSWPVCREFARSHLRYRWQSARRDSSTPRPFVGLRRRPTSLESDPGRRAMLMTCYAGWRTMRDGVPSGTAYDADDVLCGNAQRASVGGATAATGPFVADFAARDANVPVRSLVDVATVPTPVVGDGGANAIERRRAQWGRRFHCSVVTYDTERDNGWWSLRHGRPTSVGRGTTIRSVRGSKTVRSTMPNIGSDYRSYRSLSVESPPANRFSDRSNEPYS